MPRLALVLAAGALALAAPASAAGCRDFGQAVAAEAQRAGGVGEGVRGG